MKKKHKNIDVAGSISSFVCALHCMAFPVLLSFGVIGSNVLWIHDSVEILVLFLSVGLAILSIRSALRQSAEWYVHAIMITGVIFLFVGFFFMKDLNHTIMAVGGFSIAIGHLLNLRNFRLQTH